MNKVSCVTVTRNRIHHLSNCINLFIEQTYKNKELVIVYYSTDKETEKYLKAQQERLDNNNIKIFKFIDEDEFFLGSIRNFAISKATGEWICIWDDDDWYDKSRIKSQLDFCLENKVNASTLKCIMIFSNKFQELKLSFERESGWEGSLICKKDSMPKYKNIKSGEDTPVLYTLMNRNELMTQFNPELYVYIFHDSNTSNTRHKQTIFDNSYKLDIKKNREFKEKLNWL